MSQTIVTIDWNQLSAGTRRQMEELIRADELIRQYTDELYTRPCYREFFDQYHPESVHAFIREYARRKAQYRMAEEENTERSEPELKWRCFAESCLAEIQQKKLFNLQCLWRAEQVHLDGIQTTADFLPLEFKIFSVPFLSPITEHELNLYLEYLMSVEKVTDHTCRWQDYDRMKEAYQSHHPEDIPAWYRFYDTALGSTSLLSLEDKKGEAEKQILQKVSYGSVPDRASMSDDRPRLEFNYHTLEFFVYTFENKKIIRQFLHAERFHPDIDNNKMLFDSWNMLLESDEEIPVSGSGDWKAVLIQTADQYRRKKTAQALTALFKEYNLRLSTGIPFTAACNEPLFEHYSEKAACYRQLLTRIQKQAGSAE
jgi:hypothetical protein